jgi:hypothetical protein
VPKWEPRVTPQERLNIKTRLAQRPTANTIKHTIMATVTVTETHRKRRLPKNVKLPPENERYMRACADIASALIQDYEAQANGSKAKKDLNLNKLRGEIAKQHYLKSQPPLTAIIAAVPEHYKKYILPKLIAKPIRTLPTWKYITGCSNLHVYQEHLQVLQWWRSCASRIAALTSLTQATSAFTAQEDQTRTLSTQRNLTQAMNPHLCAPFERGMILMSRLVDE